jgi:hypothetical protein
MLVCCWVRPFSFGAPPCFPWRCSLRPWLVLGSRVRVPPLFRPRLWRWLVCGFFLRCLGFLMAARSFGSSVFSGLSAALVAAPVPFVLPGALASLPGVSFSAPVSVVSAFLVAGGVVLVCSDGASRRCNWATVARFRGAASAAGAARFFADPSSLVGRSFRFVAVGGWSSSQWFAAVVSV